MVNKMDEGIIRLANALDEQGMIGFTRSFVEDIRVGREAVNRELLPWITEIDRGWAGVLFLGMGGSAAGGYFVSALCDNEGSIPIRCNRNYELPNWWTPDWLVVATSYSGNTEETTIAIEEAKQRGCHVIGICSGGKLKGFCTENDFDCIVVPGGNPPRSALAYSLVQLLHIFAVLGFVSHENKDKMLRAGQLIENENESINNIAKEMAKHLFGKVGIYYAETKYEGVIVRARQQFNENSKYLGWHHVIPEMNHNELVGWTGGDERFAPIFFNTGDLYPRNYRRFEISQDR